MNYSLRKLIREELHMQGLLDQVDAYEENDIEENDIEEEISDKDRHAAAYLKLANYEEQEDSKESLRLAKEKERLSPENIKKRELKYMQKQAKLKQMQVEWQAKNTSKVNKRAERAEISALFVQENGAYDKSAKIDAWHVLRDATKFEGNLPIVAHPPCQRWSKLAPTYYKVWGTNYLKPGNDEGTFKIALDAVNKNGGVLEHPAYVTSWPKFGLTKPPKDGGWIESGEGWTCLVWQSTYGHKANKPTWLYYKGNKPPLDLNWEHVRGSHVVTRNPNMKKDNPKWRPHLKSQAERDASPLAFKRILIKLAKHSR